MASNGRSMGAKNGATSNDDGRPTHQIKQNDWKCPSSECQRKCRAGIDCRKDERGMWVWAKKDVCPRCDTKKPPKPTIYADTNAGKQAVAGRDDGKQGGGAGDTSANAKLRKDVQKLRDEKEQRELEEEKRKLEKDDRKPQETIGLIKINEG